MDSTGPDSDAGPVRRPAVAGLFYPDRPDRVEAELDRLLKPSAPRPAAAIVVPHAGWAYSGRVAGEVYGRVAPPHLAIILGPNHTGLGPAASVMARGCWAVPGGEVPIAEELARALLSATSILEADELAHRREHAIEVQLPFLRRLQPRIAFVPITVMRAEPGFCEEIGRALASVLRGWSEPVLIICSTDLNHYEPQAESNRKDRLAIEALLSSKSGEVGCAGPALPELAALQPAAPDRDGPREHSLPPHRYAEDTVPDRAGPAHPPPQRSDSPASVAPCGFREDRPGPTRRIVRRTSSSARRHADGAVEPDGLAIEHDVLDDMGRQRSILGRAAEAGREGDLLAQRDARGLGQPRQHRCFENARRDRDDADAHFGQIARDGQSHADDAALGGRVGGLTDLAVEGGHRRRIDDHPALAFLIGLILGHVRRGQPDAVESADQIDLDGAREGREVGRPALAKGLLGRADAGAVDEDVNGAEARDRRVERDRDLIRAGHVARREHRVLPERRRRLSTGRFGQVQQRDAPAGAAQALGRRPAQSRGSACDHRGRARDLHGGTSSGIVRRPRSITGAP